MIRVLCGAGEVGAYSDLYYYHNNGYKIVVREFAEGCVVATREANYYDDSDFYATYYDADTDSFKEVCYASTRGWTYAAFAGVDATPEVAAKYAAFKAAELAAYVADRAAVAALIPTAGKRVVMSFMRGKNKFLDGVNGVVFWYGENKFGRGNRVGVDVDGTKYFFAAGNVTVVAA